jgi:hypothetical protein
LQVFLEGDSGTTFIDIRRVIGATHKPSFQQMKLLVLRVNNMHELLVEKQRTEDDFCPRDDSSGHHHSVWRYLGLRYTCFHGCDCVLVETGVHGNGDEVYKSLWELFRELFLDHTGRLEKLERFDTSLLEIQSMVTVELREV